MGESILEICELDATRAMTLGRQAGDSFVRGGEYAQGSSHWGISGVPVQTQTFVSGPISSGVASAWGSQFVLAPDDQDLSIWETHTADFSACLRKRLVFAPSRHGVHSRVDVADLLDYLFRDLEFASGAWIKSEFDAERFRSTLVGLLVDNPIEDCIAHSAEELIQGAFHRNPPVCLKAIAQALKDSYQNRPSLSASILRCIGRMELDRVRQWGLTIVKKALSHEDVEIRDAAIRALEKWGGHESVRILQQHRDSEDWLNDYVRQIILDLADDAT